MVFRDETNTERNTTNPPHKTDKPSTIIQQQMSGLTTNKSKSKTKKRSGNNGSVIKADHEDSFSDDNKIRKKHKTKKSSIKPSTKVNDDVRSTIYDALPTDMITKIALDTDIGDIANLCRTDTKIAKMCDSFIFWHNYLGNNNDKFFDLIAHLLKAKEYNLFLFLWANTDKFGIDKDNKMYQYAMKTADRRKNNDLLLKIWKYAPIANRSYFHEDVVKQLNKFLKSWGIAPLVGYDPDDWYFVKHDDTFEYEQYSFMNKPIKQWEKLKEMVIFTGSFYQLATPATYSITPATLDDSLHLKLPYIHVDTRDTVSRSFRWNVDVKVTDVIANIAYLGYDPIMEVSNHAGVIEKITIDESSKYPTLLINFEES